MERIDYLEFGNDVVFVTSDYQQKFVDDISMHFFHRHAKSVPYKSRFIYPTEGLLGDELEDFRQWLMRAYHKDFSLSDEIEPYILWDWYGKEYLSDL